MRDHSCRHQRGFTLLEALITLLVLALVLSQVVPAWSSALDRASVVSAANRLHGLMRFSRASVMERGPAVVVCGRDCPGFEDPLTVTVFRDLDGDFRLDDGEELLRRTRFGELGSLHWNFGVGPDGLRYLPPGQLYYQNGHFLLCAGSHGRRIVTNWIGRTRVEKAGKGACPP